MGCIAADEEILAWLRKTHPSKPVVLAVNKCDNVAKADLQASEFWALGLEPVAVSAISGSGEERRHIVPWPLCHPHVDTHMANGHGMSRQGYEYMFSPLFRDRRSHG